MKYLFLIVLFAWNGFGAALFDRDSSNCFIGPISGPLLNGTTAISISSIRTMEAGGDVFYLFSKGDAGSSQKSLFQVQSSSGFGYWSSLGGQQYSWLGGVLGAGPPFGVAVSYVYGISNINVFTNGVLQTGKAWSSSIIPNVLPDVNNPFPIRVGSRQGTITGQYYRGTLSDLALWAVDLNAFECALVSGSRLKRMPLQIRRASLAAYWTFDEGQSGTTITTAHDWSGNGNNLTNEITAPIYAPDRALSYPPNE